MTLTLFPHAMPLSGLIGGGMIGLSAAILLLGAGRIAGISGLFARASAVSDSGPPWKLAFAFIISMLIGAFLVNWWTGGIEIRYTGSTLLLLTGGLIVGFGTRLGSGCTSGHGVCGMSRLSVRSLVATPIFMGSGMVTVAIMNITGITP